YTDQPCPGGERLDIRPGVAPDPAALERLARIRSELDRSAERRRVEEPRAIAQRALARDLARQAAEQRAEAQIVTMVPYDNYEYAGGWYVPTWPRVSHRFRSPRSREHQRFAPLPPY